MKEALTESNQQIKASGVCQTSLDLNRVLWSDETKMDVFGHVHRRHVCSQKRDAYKEKHLIPTVKYGGGSFMLWGTFAVVQGLLRSMA